jgi:fructose-1,6-bisphosphatase I/sedoheptulose-1,7-bisphosphatase
MGNFTALVNDIRLACKRIATLIGKGALAGSAGETANEIFMRTNEWGGQLAGMVSEEMDAPYVIRAEYPRGRYLLACSTRSTAQRTRT